MKQTKKFFIIIGLTIITVVITTSTFAATIEPNKSKTQNNRHSSVNSKTPRYIGTVSSIDGLIITIEKNNGFKNMGQEGKIVYKVDASKAILNKFTPTVAGSKPTPALILISDIKVGDTLIVQGVLDGSDISATIITDGSLSENRVFNNNKDLDKKYGKKGKIKNRI